MGAINFFEGFFLGNIYVLCNRVVLLKKVVYIRSVICDHVVDNCLSIDNVKICRQ